MKKLTIAIISLVLCITSLQGCSKQNDHGLDPDKPVTLSLWNYYSGAQKIAFDELVDTFNQTTGKEKGIIVEVTSMVSINNIQIELQNSLDKKVNAYPLPDIFSTYADMVETMNEENLLVSFKDYLSEKEMNMYIESYLEEGRLYANEDIKIFPVAKASEVFIINKTAWDKFASATGASLDQLRTWEGVAKIAKQYYDYSQKAFFGRDALMNYLNTGSAQLGSELFTVTDKEASFTVDKDVMRTLWDNFYVPYINGYYTKKGKFASDDIKTSDIIASVSSSAGATFFPKEIVIDGNTAEKIEYQVLPIPNFDNTKPYAISQGAGMAVSKSNETKEYASVLFLKWMTQPEENIKFTAASSYMPVTKEANDLTLWEKTIEANDIELSTLITDTIKVSMEQVNQSTLYNSQNFNNSYQARTYLEKGLLTIAEQDHEAVLKAMNQGKSREEAIKTFISDDYFNAWFDKINQDLAGMLKGSNE